MNNYIAAVLARLPTPTDPMEVNFIGGLQKDGFTTDEAVAYCMCTEEFNPTLDETVALRRMAAIMDKVEKRKAGQ